MGFRYSFVDSTVYGTEDINDITRSLVGAGVAPFLAKDSYNVSDLNSLTEALVETGTSLDGCKCSVEDAGTEAMTAHVAQGMVFFESGVRLEVDENGYSMSVTPNTAGYIYAHYSPSLQKADIVFSAEYPEDGEYVVLARLGEDGSLKDERIFARSKVATLGQNITQKVQITEGAPEGVVAMGNNIYGYIENVNFSHCNYILLDNLDSEGVAKGRTIFDIKENSIWSAVSNVYPGASIRYAFSGNLFTSSCYIEVVGDKIVFSTDRNSFVYPEITFI